VKPQGKNYVLSFTLKFVQEDATLSVKDTDNAIKGATGDSATIGGLSWTNASTNTHNLRQTGVVLERNGFALT
jgi:hypothetical protein